jgi:hypothetical protein
MRIVEHMKLYSQSEGNVVLYLLNSLSTGTLGETNIIVYIVYMRKIEIPKEFFKELDYKIELPTITCEICGEQILDTPSNRLHFT